MELTIRNASESELESINDVVTESWKSLESGYDPKEWEPMLARISDMKRIIGKGVSVWAFTPFVRFSPL